jgi:hypothetical protein
MLHPDVPPLPVLLLELALFTLPLLPPPLPAELVLLDAVAGPPPIPPEELVSVAPAAPAPPCPEGTPPVVKHPMATTAVSADQARLREGPFTRES